ncbi:CBS domain-containing protein [Acidocella sp.]|uniref:CBS domain-containing protein n=1 Tax=Acidocella sp. TaxID=50710 RepID=UPI00261E908A|nr:CBS domain-containing protein [Acidocella sp.]
MQQAEAKLATIVDSLKKGIAPQNESVRSFLLWFNAKRRGYRVVRQIRQALHKYGLTTRPDFERAYIDGLIEFIKSPPGAVGDTICDDSVLDPTYRVGLLPSANRRPLSVSPSASLQEIVTQMMANSFSQLPVANNPQHLRDVKGVVSWKTIGRRLALNGNCSTAQDCMEGAKIVKLEDPLFNTISIIAADDYVLVQAQDKTICGIVTASDLNDQFLALAEPFLLVGEIENRIRQLLHGKFTIQELEKAKVPGDERKIETPADLTFGEYIRLIQSNDNWNRLKVSLDRAIFLSYLKKVKDIRNDVMHFDPDGLDEDDLKSLREFAGFLKNLKDVGGF